MSDDVLRRYTPITIENDVSAPEGWRWALLTDIAKLESGHTPSRMHPEWWGGDVPWIALPDIRALDGKEAQSTTETINDLGLANSSARLLPRGTVAMSRTASIGFVTVMGRSMATSQDFVNWVCSSALDPWFLANALICSKNYLKSLSAGAIHKTIYMQTLKNLRIALPSVAEQRCIVKYLDAAKVQQMRAQKAIKAQNIELARLRQLAVDQTFSQLLSSYGAKSLTSFSQSPASFRDGPFGSLLKSDHYTPSGARVIRLQNIGSGFFVDRHEAYVSLEHFERIKNHDAQAQDVIVAALGDGARPAGRACVLPSLSTPAVVKADCFRVRLPQKRMMPDYLSQYLNSSLGQAQISARLRGATRPRVNLSILRAIEVPDAPIKAQEAAVFHIKKVQKASDCFSVAVRRQLEQLDMLPAALLSAAFSGNL